MVRRHQCLDGFDVPLGERFIERIGGRVDRIDSFGFACLGLKKACRCQKHQGEQSG
jgi:hypothetical protein